VAIGDDRVYWPTKKWKTSPPQKQGMDPEIIGQISSHVKKKYPGTYGILIIRHGYIVYEEYFRGDEDDLRQLMCVTKSVTSTLIGIALNEGYLESVDQKLIDLFPDLLSADMNSQVNKITIRHLLTMSSGVELTSHDPSNMKLMRSYSSEPGLIFHYNDTEPQILSMIITKVTKLTALDFGKKYLFKPLGISNLRWEDIYGYTNGGQSLQLTLRDLAKIGYLYLTNGRWGKKQILSPDWVSESTRTQIDVPRDVWDYGYLWWTYQINAHRVFIASGGGAHRVYGIPDLDIIMVTYAAWDAGYDKMIEEFVIPAVRY
jgi:CubicO group peptidase (beta-lactamase class C family)